MNLKHAATLETLADIQSYISRQLGTIWEQTKNKDAMLLEELNNALRSSDKFVMILRGLALIAEKGTPMKFDAEEERVLKMLEDSLRERKVIPYRRTPPEIA